MSTLYNHILGGLYGQALGDAWAMPALYAPEQTWQRFGGWITDFLPGPAEHQFHPNFRAARITDDTEQALALAEAIIADGEVTVDGTARAIVAWYDAVGGDQCTYIGPSTRRAVTKIKQGIPLEKTGRFGDTNGAAMRVSPVGLIHPGNVIAATHDAARSCVPTHYTDVATSGAAAIAGAVACALQPSVSLDAIVQAGIEAAELGRTLGPTWLGASIARRIELAVEIGREPTSERTRLQRIYDLVGATVYISESVPAAFGVLVMGNGDPVQTAIYAAALSGDADTIGAMACAIAGAWQGADCFTLHHLEQLRTANPEVDFERVARGLLQVAEKNMQ